MPQVELVKKRSKGPAVIVAVVVAVVTVAAVVGMVFLAKKTDQADQDYAAAVHQADGQMRLLHYDQAVRAYQDYLDTYPKTVHTYRMQIHVAETYQQKGDYASALDWYQKAEKTNTSLDLVVKPGIALAAQQLGQKDLSIRYYKQTIDLLNKADSPSKAMTIREYQESITAQGGQP